MHLFLNCEIVRHDLNFLTLKRVNKMNIYLLIEDGESFCIKAESMGEAVEVCLRSYLDDMEDQEGERFNREHEVANYHKEVLQSCSLVGPLKN